MKKPYLLLTLAYALPMLLSQCRSDENRGTREDEPPHLHRHTYQQNLMGTRFFVTLYTAEEKTANLAAKEAFQLAAEINDTCSDYDVTSELMRLNADPSNQAIPVSDMLFDLLSLALNISQQTHGAYDPTLGHHSYNWRMARKKGSSLPQRK